MIAYVILGVAVVGTISSTIVFVLAVLGAIQFRRSARRDRETYAKLSAKLPPVSVLKPVHGNESRLKENIESFFRQDYPEFEVLFAADEPDDPALPVIREICARYPHIHSQILVTGQPPWPNAPNYCFHRLTEIAAHDILVTSDSDVEVAPDYLRDVVPPLLDPKVGAVTCIFRGKSAGGTWAALDAIGMSVEFTAGVLIANLLEGMKFGLDRPSRSAKIPSGESAAMPRAASTSRTTLSSAILLKRPASASCSPAISSIILPRP